MEENVMRCLICLEEVNIPISFLCFPCHWYKAPFHSCGLQTPCSAYTRVCISCGEIYLELTKTISNRSERKRCLLCPTECRLAELNRNNAYTIDYLWMREHDRLQTVSEWECPWCPQKGGQSVSRTDLFHHLQVECPNFHMICQCDVVVRRCEWLIHQEICPHYVFCEECLSYFPKSEMTFHMLNIHRKTQCTLCKDYIPMKNFLHHIVQCSMMNDHHRTSPPITRPLITISSSTSYPSSSSSSTSQTSPRTTIEGEDDTFHSILEMIDLSENDD